MSGRYARSRVSAGLVTGLDVELTSKSFRQLRFRADIDPPVEKERDAARLGRNPQHGRLTLQASSRWLIRVAFDCPETEARRQHSRRSERLVEELDDRTTTYECAVHNDQSNVIFGQSDPGDRHQIRA